MKVTWIFERKRYTISGHRSGKMYLNKHIYDCTEILDLLESKNPTNIFYAKVKAKHAFIELSKRHDHEPHVEHLIEQYGFDYEQKQREEHMKLLKDERKRAKESATIEADSVFLFEIFISACILVVALIFALCF